MKASVVLLSLRRYWKLNFPKDFRLLKLESYDGTDNPLDYTRSYQATMMLCNFKDAILC